MLHALYGSKYLYSNEFILMQGNSSSEITPPLHENEFKRACQPPSSLGILPLTSITLSIGENSKRDGRTGRRRFPMQYKTEGQLRIAPQMLSKGIYVGFRDPINSTKIVLCCLQKIHQASYSMTVLFLFRKFLHLDKH